MSFFRSHGHTNHSSRRYSKSLRPNPLRFRIEELEVRDVPSTSAVLAGNDSYTTRTDSTLTVSAANVQIVQAGDGEVTLPTAAGSELR